MAEITIGITSGKYAGNGTTQDILFATPWTKLTVTSSDRKYIMSFFKDDASRTIGQAAIGSGGTYKQLTVTEGGISLLDNGFRVGNHISINENGIDFFWSVS